MYHCKYLPINSNPHNNLTSILIYMFYISIINQGSLHALWSYLEHLGILHSSLFLKYLLFLSKAVYTWSVTYPCLLTSCESFKNWIELNKTWTEQKRLKRTKQNRTKSWKSKIEQYKKCIFITWILTILPNI